MGLFSVLLCIILWSIFSTEDFTVKEAATSGVWSFEMGLNLFFAAIIQSFSYPFHDPVLTDRAFITSPKVMVKGLVLAGVISGGFIVLFGMVGLYGRAFGIAGDPTVAVPAALGLPMLLVFNAIMLTSAGSTLDSTFSSTAKLAARDWPDRHDATGHHEAPTRGERRIGRGALVAIALLGNVPLLTVYLCDQVGPAIIAATTISGTMVMGLAPIFLLSFLPRAGRASFHLAFWRDSCWASRWRWTAAPASRFFPNGSTSARASMPTTWASTCTASPSARQATCWGRSGAAADRPRQSSRRSRRKRVDSSPRKKICGHDGGPRTTGLKERRPSSFDGAGYSVYRPCH
jgi:hypothetical protein